MLEIPQRFMSWVDRMLHDYTYFMDVMANGGLVGVLLGPLTLYLGVKLIKDLRNEEETK